MNRLWTRSLQLDRPTYAPSSCTMASVQYKTEKPPVKGQIKGGLRVKCCSEGGGGRRVAKHDIETVVQIYCKIIISDDQLLR